MKTDRKVKLTVLLFVAMMIVVLAGCGNPGEAAPQSTATSSVSLAPATGLADGVYSADFTTDNSMFHVTEANNGKGVLTVKDGKMTIHVSLASKKIVNLFAGTAEAANQNGAALLQPTTDSVTYSDGTTEDVYGFDIPVPAVDEEFAVALKGTKGVWYDHMVKVSGPVPVK
jgi:hypothetical protein